MTALLYTAIPLYRGPLYKPPFTYIYIYYILYREKRVYRGLPLQRDSCIGLSLIGDPLYGGLLYWYQHTGGDVYMGTVYIGVLVYKGFCI